MEQVHFVGDSPTLRRTGVELDIDELNDVGALIASEREDDPIRAGELREHDRRRELVIVSAVVFAEIEHNGHPERKLGPRSLGHVVVTDRDPTNQLLEIVATAREQHLRDLRGDLMRMGVDLTRWEIVAVPQSIELADALHERLSGVWKGRDPRRA